MQAWIMSIVGVICLGVLIEIVLPDGKITKYIKGAFSLVVILVIVSPLPSLIGKDFKVEIEDFSVSTSVVKPYEDTLEEQIEKYLADNDINAKVDVDMQDNIVDSVIVAIIQNPQMSNQSLILRTKTLIKDKFFIDTHKLSIIITN